MVAVATFVPFHTQFNNRDGQAEAARPAPTD
jgi:hypothetical protein